MLGIKATEQLLKMTVRTHADRVNNANDQSQTTHTARTQNDLRILRARLGVLTSGGGLHGNRYRARRHEKHTTKGSTPRYRADPNRGYPRAARAMGDGEGVLMSTGEYEHDFTLVDDYCVLCGAANSDEECKPYVPDYEAGRH